MIQDDHPGPEAYHPSDQDGSKGFFHFASPAIPVSILVGPVRTAISADPEKYTVLVTRMVILILQA